MTIWARRAAVFATGGLLFMVAAMPFHAFFSVWLGSLTGHQALVQAWKEALTLLIAGATLVVALADAERRARLRQPFFIAVAAFLVVALVVTAIMRPGLVAVAYGFKTDFEFLVLAGCAIVLARTETLRRAGHLAVVTGVAAAAIALVLALALPRDFLVAFGYGPTTIEPFRLVDPAIDTFRTPGTLGGPNQLGSFLIIPLCLVVARAMRRPKWWLLPAFIILAGGIWVSYSRAAVLGAVVAIAITVVAALSRRLALLAPMSLAVLAVVAAIVIAANLGGSNLQYYVLHSSAGTTDTNNSTAIRAGALAEGMKAVLAHPGGLGLGIAGPASQRTASPIVPENYYLQIALETGLAGLAAFIGILGVTARRLWLARERTVPLAMLGALGGISVVCLFLHGWADSSTAFVFWILAGLAIGAAKRPMSKGRHHAA